MNSESTPNQPRVGLFRNWTSLAGVVMIAGSVFAFVLLFLLDILAHASNPYVGILTYLVAPMFTAIGFALVFGGFLWRRWRQIKTHGTVPVIQIDLTRVRDRRIFGYFLGGSACFLLATAVLSYHTYHFTESVQFCGQACHTVMKPELVTYLHGPHARVSCSECHIGPGAGWYVRSKLSGMYQVYATTFNKYPRPIPTPIKNLRPAQETCEQCHWPQKFVGNLDRTYNYFLGDDTNTPFTVRLTMKVGGGDPTHGPVGGIHWHMNVGNKVQYVATDETRQSIPWVRMTDAQGVVTEFRTAGFTNEVSASEVRMMDCMDCHNRPAHRFATPNSAVNLAMALGKIDRSIPGIKTNAVDVLVRTYESETEAFEKIATALSERYADQARIRPVINVVQQIYKDNFFPEMKATWETYQDNIGHKDWPGCFRCHDGKHATADGKRTIKANDCNACHTILAQGSGDQLHMLTPEGQEFKHPGGEFDGLCNDCHTGGL